MQDSLGTHLRAPALKTEDFSKNNWSGSRKRGVECKGGSLHGGFDGSGGSGGSGEHLTLRLLVLQNAAQ